MSQFEGAATPEGRLKVKKKKKKDEKQSLGAFLGVQSQQEMIIHNVDSFHDESWKHSKSRG